MSITDELRKETRSYVYTASQTDRLTAIANRIDAALEEGYIELPKDTDGVTIRIGDGIETLMGEGGTCVAIELCENGGWNVIIQPSSWNKPTLFAAESVRHAQPDSWESIIEDAMEAYQFDDGSSEPSIGSLVERCKRLAGEEA